MKRGEALERMTEMFGPVAVALNYGDGVNVDSGLMLMIWRYLNEEISETVDEEAPTVAPTACQPGKVVDVWEEPKKERKGGRTSTVDTGKLIALRKAGWTTEQIAEELNVDKSTVSYHVAKLKKEGQI